VKPGTGRGRFGACASLRPDQTWPGFSRSMRPTCPGWGRPSRCSVSLGRKQARRSNLVGGPCDGRDRRDSRSRWLDQRAPRGRKMRATTCFDGRTSSRPRMRAQRMLEFCRRLVNRRETPLAFSRCRARSSRMVAGSNPNPNDGRARRRPCGQAPERPARDPCRRRTTEWPHCSSARSPAPLPNPAAGRMTTDVHHAS